MEAAPNPEQILGDIARMGRIFAVDVNAKTCTVEIGEMVSPPLQWFAIRAGKVRKWSPPTVGEQCLVICPEADTASGIVLLGLYSAAFPSPSDNPDCDVTEYGDGARVLYDQAAHALSAILPAGGTAAITADGGIKIKGDVEVTGTLHVTQSVTADEDVAASGISLKGHTHKGVKAGTDISGKPQ